MNFDSYYRLQSTAAFSLHRSTTLTSPIYQVDRSSGSRIQCDLYSQNIVNYFEIQILRKISEWIVSISVLMFYFRSKEYASKTDIAVTLRPALSKRAKPTIDNFPRFTDMVINGCRVKREQIASVSWSRSIVQDYLFPLTELSITNCIYLSSSRYRY